MGLNSGSKSFYVPSTVRCFFTNGKKAVCPNCFSDEVVHKYRDINKLVDWLIEGNPEYYKFEFNKDTPPENMPVLFLIEIEFTNTTIRFWTDGVFKSDYNPFTREREMIYSSAFLNTEHKVIGWTNLPPIPEEFKITNPEDYIEYELITPKK